MSHRLSLVLGLISLCLGLSLLVFTCRTGWAQKDIPSEVNSLIEKLKDPDEEVRQNAAKALGEIGPEAKAAIPALREALKDDYKAVRKAAEDALKEIES